MTAPTLAEAAPPVRGTIVPSLAVLWAFGAAFIALATVLLRRQPTDGS